MFENFVLIIIIIFIIFNIFKKINIEKFNNNQKLNFCILHANAPTRSLIFQSDNCNILNSEWDFSKDPKITKLKISGFKTKQPDTSKYCIQYANNPLRSLIYKANSDDECVPKWGWGHFNPAVGYGGEFYFYDKQSDNADKKYCYSYNHGHNDISTGGLVTLITQSDENNECKPIWPFDKINEVYGNGGYFYS